MHLEDLAVRHLALRLGPINRALELAVTSQTEAAAQLERPDLAQLCVTDQHVQALLRGVAQNRATGTNKSGHYNLTTEEQDEERSLHVQADEAGLALPLDVMLARLKLSQAEIESLLICAAVEINRDYERIYAYILDDLNRRFPCVELLCNLMTRDYVERLSRRRFLSPYGRLRRSGLLESFGESTTGQRTQLRLGPGVFEFLLGASPSVAGLWLDPHEVDLSQNFNDESNVRINSIGQILARGDVQLVGVWAPALGEADDVAARIAKAAGFRLCRLSTSDRDSSYRGHLLSAIHSASTSGALLQIPVDSLHDIENQVTASVLEDLLTRCETPTMLTGTEPWRPTSLLEVRSYTEIELDVPNHSHRAEMWSEVLPEVDRSRLDDIASRFRMSGREMHAVANVARVEAKLRSNGKPARVEDQLDTACAAVARKARTRFVRNIKPSRTADDLILPDELYRQVLEVVSFTKALPCVAETWGFGRLATGGSGIKCLFTGDPGTGKTLAAEVIAHGLGVPLLKVNIGETVSKWVGETEKNLDAAFDEASSAHGLLFFDEADALFGKRGEVRHGVDRFANMEVSHLLQKLEAHAGLVILASNLKDNIDPAFTRRFHVALHFPRPSEADRRRLWQMAFPPEAPVDDFDLATISRLDMTGAGIVSAARTAALLAATEHSARISMRHLVHGVSRQFLREARVLTTAELGPHAALLQG